MCDNARGDKRGDNEEFNTNICLPRNTETCRTETQCRQRNGAIGVAIKRKFEPRDKELFFVDNRQIFLKHSYFLIRMFLVIMHKRGPIMFIFKYLVEDVFPSNFRNIVYIKV